MDKIVTEFEASLRQLVAQFFPKLVALMILAEQKVQAHSPAQWLAKINELRAAGVKAVDIAEQLGISYNYVFALQRQQREGKLIPAASTKAVASSANGSLAEVLAKHGSKKAAAKALGMAESTFRDRLAKEKAA